MMAVQARIEAANVLPDGRLELTVSILVNGQAVAQDSMVFHDPASLTLAQIRDKVKDRVLASKEKLKSGATAKTLVGQMIDIEP